VSNSPKNKEQDQLISQTPTQLNPYEAKPADFKIEDRGPGQTGDTKAERAVLLAEADHHSIIARQVKQTKGNGGESGIRIYSKT
jgi:hypothetical protein